MFQSTHPHGVRLAQDNKLTMSRQFQSTHPHGVRRDGQGTTTSRPCFNPRIHTGCDSRVRLVTGRPSKVSIHAPTRGATIRYTSLFLRDKSFNPRTHTGCDKKVLATYSKAGAVSIHAPTRGATPSPYTPDLPYLFQSTHPHGVRQRRISQGEIRCCFNPRTHTGCDASYAL